MAINFPSSPADGFEYTDANSGTWVYDSGTNSWTLKAAGNTSPFNYKGGWDFASSTAPTPVASGDLWNHEGTDGATIDAVYTGMSGTIAKGQMVLYDGAKYVKVGSTPGYPNTGDGNGATLDDRYLRLKGMASQTVEGNVLIDSGVKIEGSGLVTTKGDVKVGGTSADPNIQLKASDGSASFAGGILSGDASGNFINIDGTNGALTVISDTTTANVIQYGRNGAAPLFTIDGNGSATFDGGVKVGPDERLSNSYGYASGRFHAISGDAKINVLTTNVGSAYNGGIALGNKAADDQQSGGQILGGCENDVDAKGQLILQTYSDPGNQYRTALTLDSSQNAAFDGYVSVGGPNEASPYGCYIRPIGGVFSAAIAADIDNYAFEAWGGGSQKVSIKHDGSGQFAKQVTSGGSPGSGGAAGTSISQDGFIAITNNDKDATVFYGFTQKDQAGGSIYPTSRIYANGSATFALAKAWFSTDGSLYLGSAGDIDNTVANRKIYLYSATGNATFVGDVTAGNVSFNLEPENPDNYEVSTETYTVTEYIEVPVINKPGTGTADIEDGVSTADLVNERETKTVAREVEKTREVKTYVGPTMEVKETLLKITAALEGLRTAAESASTCDELKSAINTALADI